MKSLKYQLKVNKQWPNKYSKCPQGTSVPSPVNRPMTAKLLWYVMWTMNSRQQDVGQGLLKPCKSASDNGALSLWYQNNLNFDFHIVNFPFLSSNIPSGPSYGVYISQLIRYARCCSHYDDFRYRHKCLVDRLLSQGYKALRLEKSFKKFYGRYQDLIEKYRRSVNAMVSDSFPGQFLFNM